MQWHGPLPAVDEIVAEMRGRFRRPRRPPGRTERVLEGQSLVLDL